MKKLKKNEKGITLVALITMIIIMTLLASVVAMNFSNNQSLWDTGKEYKNNIQEMTTNTENYENEEQKGWSNVINKKGIEDELDNNGLNFTE